MADDIVQLPPDGAGKKLDNDSLTVGANTVYRQRVRITGAAAADLAGVTAANGLAVDVTRSIPGTGATNLGKAEDAAHTSGDTGVFALGVSNEAATAMVSADGDYTALATTKAGVLQTTDVGGFKASYSAATSAIASAASCTDIFTITGSGTKTIRVTRLGVSGVQTTAANVLVLVLKRSTANSSGTSASVTAVPHDSNNAAATATVLSYTANPTTGTLVGNVRADRLFVPAAATATANAPLSVYQFGDTLSQPVVLRGTTQVLAVNLGGVTVTGGSFNFYIEWTEE